MNNSDTLFPSSSTTSTIRPRNRRLISLDDENGFEPVDTGAASSSSFSTVTPRNPSRGASPIPSAHLSRRQAEAGVKATSSRRREGERSTPNSRLNGSTPSAGLWDSWSSLQGLASTLLGSDAQSSFRSIPNGGLKVPTWKKANKDPVSSRSVPEWGPSIDTVPQLAAGTQEERQAMVQAKKRETLLLASAHIQTDKTGRFKRRDSDTSICVPSEHDEDALVYVHKVQPADTLAGVMIKYNCQQAVFRKVNRFWPNDNIHIRTHVFLPVEACGVRGKKLEDVQGNFDLLESDNNASTATKNDLHDPSPARFDVHNSSDPLSLSLSLTSSHDTTSYKHESWVRIPNTPEPVEILRMPRRTLGFFPPARRKSITFSDTSDRANSDSTPKSSFDMLRHPPTHAASQNASPARRPLHTRAHRSSSTTSTTNAVSFADRLKGPGGVGTLRVSNMSKPVPGPAEDPLNKMFAHHLPSVAPPGSTPRSTSRATPRVSIDSIRSNSSTGLGEVGGAIEGWVRKLGGKAVAKSEGFRERMGDLIELEGTGMGEEGSAAAEEEEENGGDTPTLTMNANEEALLSERFPPRGRIRDAYPGKGKGKAD